MFLAVFGLYLSGRAVYAGQGPDDAGAIAHAISIVQKKYGPAAIVINAPKIDFRKDRNDPTSGVYVFDYVLNGRKGRVICHYDAPTAKFNGDSLGPPLPLPQ
jgi:hypothetical protein